MKILSRAFAIIFAAAAIAVAAFSVKLILDNRDSAPVLVTRPAAAEARAKTMMESIRTGDFAAAGEILYGTPSLGTLTEDAGETERMIWDAFVDSIAYEFTGESYASGSGIAMDVNIHSLDIASVTANLKDRAQTLLNSRVAAAEDVDEIYDEKNNYKEAFVMQVLQDAATQALAEDAKYVDRSLTLHLVYEREQWWVMPEQELLSAISGGIS